MDTGKCFFRAAGAFFLMLSFLAGPISAQAKDNMLQWLDGFWALDTSATLSNDPEVFGPENFDIEGEERRMFYENMRLVFDIKNKTFEFADYGEQARQFTFTVSKADSTNIVLFDGNVDMELARQGEFLVMQGAFSRKFFFRRMTNKEMAPSPFMQRINGIWENVDRPWSLLVVTEKDRMIDEEHRDNIAGHKPHIPYKVVTETANSITLEVFIPGNLIAYEFDGELLTTAEVGGPKTTYRRYNGDK